MKRCKAVTSRACDSIECCLLADHEGAHEGQRDKETRAVWTNPEAPEYMPLDDGKPVDGSRLAHEAARAAFEREQAASIRPLPDVAPPRTRKTHCACGTEHHQEMDPMLRTVGAMPLAAYRDEIGTLDYRFQWPRVCRECGAVYCPFVKTF